MAEVNERINSAGDIIWDDLYITNYKGSRLDILALVNEVNLFEDIFSNSMYGNIIMVDTHNLLSVFPIIGQERIYIKCHTPKMGATAMIDKMFKVVKISDKVVEGNKQVYVLHFISYDAYADMTTTENKVLKGTADEIITSTIDRMRSFKSVDQETITKISGMKDLAKPANMLKIISPQWSPFECIAYAVKQSVSSDGIGDYLFWETYGGYHLKRITDLFKQEVKDYFAYDHSQPAGNPEQQFIKIMDLRYDTINDQIRLILNRAYGQTIFSHNILTKQFTKKTFEISNLKQTPTMNGKKTFVDQDIDFLFMPAHNSEISHLYPYNAMDITRDRSDEAANTRIPYINLLDYTKVDIDVWGRTWLQAGDIVAINLGKYTQSSDTNLNSIDPYTSGKYLVTAIHHRMAPAQHKMTMQCIKESQVENWKPL